MARQFVVFQLSGSDDYCLGIEDVQEIVKVESITRIPTRRNTCGFEGVTNLRGTLYRVFNLRKRFGLESSDKAFEERRLVVVSRGDLKFGVLVDNVSEIVSVEEDEIEDVPVLAQSLKDKAIESVLNLKEGGRLIAVLDPTSLFPASELEGNLPEETGTGS